MEKTQMRSQQKQAADDAAVQAQIQAVPHQSDDYRELDAKIWAAAGNKPGPLKFRMKHNGEILESGYECARHAILSGVAELVEPC
jgi:hypothetical protein